MYGFSFACDHTPRIHSAHVVIAIACILVERRLPASFSRIEEQRQRISLFLAYVIHRWPERHRCISTDIEGRLAKGSVCQNMSRSIHALAGPEVEPRSRRNIDMAILRAGAQNGRDQQ